MERAYRQTTRVTAILLMGVGLAMIATAVVRGAGPLALGVIVGVLFTALGAGRLYLAADRTARRDGE